VLFLFGFSKELKVHLVWFLLQLPVKLVDAIKEMTLYINTRWRYCE